MALELNVYVNREKLPSATRWKQEIARMGFTWTFPGRLDWAEQSGHLPARLNRRETGFELDVFANTPDEEPPAEATEFDSFVGFRFSTPAEAAAAHIAAAALAKLTGGFLFNPDENRPWSADDALREARGILEAEAKEQKGRPSARPVPRLIQRHILPHFPGWAFHRRVMFETPAGPLMCGIGFDPWSGRPESFDIEPFVRPLYAPSPYSLSVFRVPPRKRAIWSIEPGREQDVATEFLEVANATCLPFIRGRDTPAKFAAELERERERSPRNPYVTESLAFTRVWMGDGAAAIEPLNAAIHELEPESHPEDAQWRGAWQDTMLDRLRRFREMLLADPPAAKRLLEQTVIASAEELGIRRWLK